jgi:arabinosaccharide transport system substrate-binding protein
MLCYRRDIVEDELGIDINQLETWDDFTRIGRQVTKDLDGDGNPDRFMIDLDKAGGDFIIPLLQQRDEGLFDVDGNLTIDTEGVIDTIVWYIRQCYGPNRIAFSAGWGQTLAKTISDGLVLFYYCPDWRSKQFEMDVPQLEGKLALMPLPAWKPGERRVSTWGGTGLAITKACKNKELAWAYAKKLYLKREDLGDRFMASYILPPVKDAWELPIFQTPIPLYSNQPIGQLYAALAPDIPPNYASPYYELARSKLSEAFLNAAQYYQEQGKTGLRDYTRTELKRVSAYVKKVMIHNVFYADAMQNTSGETSNRTMSK